MAKVIKYNLCTKVNRGTEEEPKIVEILSPVTMGWNEANEEIAKREAYNGEYAVEDDGAPISSSPNFAARLEILEQIVSKLKEAFPGIRTE